MKNTKLTWVAIVFLSIFLIIFFTKWQIYAFVEKRAQKENLLKENTEKNNEHLELKLIDLYLNDKKKVDEIIAEKPDLKKDFLEKIKQEIPKYKKEFKEEEILNYIYSEIYKLNRVTSQVKINNLTITPGVVSPMQFLESDINLSIEVVNEKILRNLLNTLVSSDEYKFFIEKLTIPEKENNLDSAKNTIQIQIPLKIYYK